MIEERRYDLKVVGETTPWSNRKWETRERDGKLDRVYYGSSREYDNLHSVI